MAFGSFGDSDTRGYLLSDVATNNAALLTSLETNVFAANVLPALAALKAARTVGYGQVPNAHRRLFRSL